MALLTNLFRDHSNKGKSILPYDGLQLEASAKLQQATWQRSFRHSDSLAYLRQVFSISVALISEHSPGPLVNAIPSMSRTRSSLASSSACRIAYGYRAARHFR